MPGVTRRPKPLKATDNLSSILGAGLVNPSEGDLLVYDSVDGRFENSKAMTGNYAITGDLSVSNLSVTDDILLTDDLTVGGNTALSGSLTVGTTLDVTGAVTANSTLQAGATILTSTLSVAGLLTGAGFTFSGNGNVDGTLTVGTLSLANLATGNGSFTGNVDIAGYLQVGGVTILNDALTVNSSIAGQAIGGTSLSSSGDITGAGSLIIAKIGWSASGQDVTAALTGSPGVYTITGVDTTLAVVNMLRLDPDADAKLYFNGAEVARTLAAASGGFEVNNTLTGGGFERVLTVSDVDTLQAAYDAATTAPQITLNATPDPFTIDASVAGDIFALRDSSNIDRLRVSDTEIGIGRTGRRHFRVNSPDATGRVGTELWPDDFSVTTATGSGAAFFTDAARTITLNIPGGGGLGNDTAPGGMNFGHTVRFEDTGFAFAAQLLINAAVRVECATNTVGPLYLFLDQYRTYADGGARTCSQHNALRAQPSWGPNINGGSITQTSAELFFASASVDATVGTATVTTLNYFAANAPGLTAGGTIGTLNVMNIPNIPAAGITTLRGINSAMSSGTFVQHVGTAPVELGGALRLSTGASAADWEITRLSANIATLATGDSLRISTGNLFFGSTGSVALSSSVADRLDLATGDSFRIVNGALEHVAGTVGFYGATPVAQSAAYTRNATIVEDRTLLASASATTTNNNNVLAALIADLQAIGILG